MLGGSFLGTIKAVISLLQTSEAVRQQLPTALGFAEV